MDNNTRYLILGIIVIALLALIELSYTLNNTSAPMYNGTFNNSTNSTPTAGMVLEGNITVTPIVNMTAMPTSTPIPTA